MTLFKKILRLYKLEDPAITVELIPSLMDTVLCFSSVKSLGQSLPRSSPQRTSPITLWLPQRTLATASHQLLAG